MIFSIVRWIKNVLSRYPQLDVVNIKNNIFLYFLLKMYSWNSRLGHTAVLCQIKGAAKSNFSFGELELSLKKYYKFEIE
jgi:hypothetical protein